MPMIVSGAATGIGLIGQAVAGQSAADSAGQAAIATQKQAEQTRKETMGYAAPTALELGNMNAELQSTQVQLQRQAAMYASIDPTIMESSKQMMQLLQGQSAKTIAPMLAQRNVARQQLQQQLEQQLGPGGASSSAGIQALSNFDMQTDSYTSQLQQSAIGTLQGNLQLGYTSAGQSGGQAGTLFGQIGQQAGNIASRQTGASISTSLTPFASAPFAGSIASANEWGQTFGQIGSLGSKGLGASMTPSPGGGTGIPQGDMNNLNSGSYSNLSTGGGSGYNLGG